MRIYISRGKSASLEMKQNIIRRESAINKGERVRQSYSLALILETHNVFDSQWGHISINPLYFENTVKSKMHLRHLTYEHRSLASPTLNVLRTLALAYRRAESPPTKPI